jgi:hypothetical protein
MADFTRASAVNSAFQAGKNAGKQEIVKEIVNLSYKTCGYECVRCLPMKECCTWWQRMIEVYQ